MSIDTLQHLFNTPSKSQSTVGGQSTNFHLMRMSHLTLGQLLTTVDQVGCGLSTNQSVDRQLIADAVSMIQVSHTDNVF